MESVDEGTVGKTEFAELNGEVPEIDSEGMNLESRMLKVLLDIRKIRVFYSIVYQHLKRIESNGRDGVVTMGVTSTEIIYNKEFVMKLSMEELVFVNLHEIAHIALMHPSRVGSRNPKEFNIACDLYVNKVLGEELELSPGASKTINGVLIKMPKWIVYEEGIDTKLECVESIYEKIKKDINCGNNTLDNYGPNSDLLNSDLLSNSKEDGTDGFKGGSSSELEPEVENKIRSILNDAMVAAKMQGDSVSRVELEVEKLLAPTLKWETVVRKYLRESTSRESSYSSPDRRMLYQSAIFPGTNSRDEKRVLDNMIIAIDSSGSISKEELALFIHNIKALFKQYKVDATLMFWDTQVESAGRVSEYRQLNDVKPRGGGGTSPQCIFDYINTLRNKVEMCLILTDGYIKMPEPTGKSTKIKQHTYWLIREGDYGYFNAPFGKKIELKH